MFYIIQRGHCREGKGDSSPQSLKFLGGQDVTLHERGTGNSKSCHKWLKMHHFQEDGKGKCFLALSKNIRIGSVQRQGRPQDFGLGGGKISCPKCKKKFARSAIFS